MTTFFCHVEPSRDIWLRTIIDFHPRADFSTSVEMTGKKRLPRFHPPSFREYGGRGAHNDSKHPESSIPYQESVISLCLFVAAFFLHENSVQYGNEKISNGVDGSL